MNAAEKTTASAKADDTTPPGKERNPPTPGAFTASDTEGGPNQRTYGDAANTDHSRKTEVRD
ncbi:hypothetical protein ACVGWT_11720, partial [Enterobacter hormaechei]